MKKENGITLVSLVIYVIVMTIVLGVMSSIINSFYNNTEAVKGNVQEILEFGKFNNYFLREIKTKNNKVDGINENYILFSSGNSFVLSNNIIYYNNIKLCNGVEEMHIEFGKNENEEGTKQEDRRVLNVTLKFKNFKKSINYKVEDIY